MAACHLLDRSPVLEDAVGCVAAGMLVTLPFWFLGARWRSISCATCLFVKSVLLPVLFQAFRGGESSLFRSGCEAWIERGMCLVKSVLDLKGRSARLLGGTGLGPRVETIT